MADTNSQATPNTTPAAPNAAPNTPPATPSAAPKAPAALPKIPLPHKGFQYNVCKNPTCPQFGVHPELPTRRGVLGPYAVTSGGKG